MSRPFSHMAIDGAVAEFSEVDLGASTVSIALFLCPDAALLLPLIATARGRTVDAMVDLLIAEEAERIGIARLARDGRAQS